MDDDLISELIEAGTPTALVAKVAMALARSAAAQEAIEARRQTDRERQARRRDHVTSRYITGHHVTSRDTGLDKEKSPIPPKEINPPPKVSSIARTRGNRLPADWQPLPFEPNTVAFDSVKAWEPGKMERELSKFRDHWLAASGPNASKTDWQATWRKWCTQANEWTGNGRREPPPESEIGRTTQAKLALRERVSQLGYGGVPAGNG